VPHECTDAREPSLKLQVCPAHPFAVMCAAL
jgi:hypothetical protein